MKPIHTLFTAIHPDGKFSRDALFRAKKSVPAIAPSDAKHGTHVAKVGMSLFEGDPSALTVNSGLATNHFGWIVRNPDDTFWWDSLADTAAGAWGGADPGRITKYEALGFKPVPVVFEPIK